MFDIAFYEKEHTEIYDWYREKYAYRNSYFIPDGVVDAENYAGILFLLKEAYSREQQYGEWDLAAGLAADGPWGMWHHVAKWTSGLLNSDETCISPFGDMDKEERNAMLRKIAVVNLKKVDGASTSSDDDLMQYTKDNAATLRREVAHVQPRIIVCGGTFKFLKELFGIEIKSHCDNWYYWLNLGDMENVLVLDYFHPAVRYPELLTYYGLVNIYQQALLHSEKP